MKRSAVQPSVKNACSAATRAFAAVFSDARRADKVAGGGGEAAAAQSCGVAQSPCRLRPHNVRVCTGVHPARQFDSVIEERGITDDRFHRLHNDWEALNLAAGIVRPGGMLQIVGRGMANDPRWAIAEASDEMGQLATYGPFELIEVQAFPYDEPTSGPRIAVGNPAISGHQRYTTSAIFRRQVG